jgi:hypothetical protein
MTSIAAESVSTILVSCKQTRFHIDSPNYREVRNPSSQINSVDF